MLDSRRSHAEALCELSQLTAGPALLFWAPAARSRIHISFCSWRSQHQISVPDPPHLSQDVRVPADFEAYHIPGSVNVPAFLPLEANSPDKMLKQFVYALNGVKGGFSLRRHLARVRADRATTSLPVRHLTPRLLPPNPARRGREPEVHRADEGARAPWHADARMLRHWRRVPSVRPDAGGPPLAVPRRDL